MDEKEAEARPVNGNHFSSIMAAHLTCNEYSLAQPDLLPNALLRKGSGDTA